MVPSAAVTTPVLWHFPISHFNEKVRWALDWKGIPHVRRALGATYFPRALLASGQPRLPILFLDGRAVSDSTRIIAELEARRPEPPLHPADPAARRRALELEDFFDENLGPPIRTALVGPGFERDPAAVIDVLTTGMAATNARVMRAAVPVFRAFYRFRHAINDATIAASRGQIAAGLDRIERELQPSGYLVGERFSVADLTAAAFLAIFARPPEMQYPPARPMPPDVADYVATLADRPALAWVREMYRRHRGRSLEVAA
jgi:glutathione S-transferase